MHKRNSISVPHTRTNALLKTLGSNRCLSYLHSISRSAMAHRILTPETILEESLRVQRLANATFKVPASSSTTSTVPATPTPTYFQQDMPAVSLPSEAPTAVLPIRRHKFPTPKLRLKLYDLGHEGSVCFSISLCYLNQWKQREFVDSCLTPSIVRVPVEHQRQRRHRSTSSEYAQPALLFRVRTASPSSLQTLARPSHSESAICRIILWFEEWQNILLGPITSIPTYIDLSCIQTRHPLRNNRPALHERRSLHHRHGPRPRPQGAAHQPRLHRQHQIAQTSRNPRRAVP